VQTQDGMCNCKLLLGIALCTLSAGRIALWFLLSCITAAIPVDCLPVWVTGSTTYATWWILLLADPLLCP
jgi:hypothetical protein